MPTIFLATTIAGIDVPSLLPHEVRAVTDQLGKLSDPIRLCPLPPSAVSPPKSSRTRKDYTPLHVLNWMKDSGAGVGFPLEGAQAGCGH